MLNLKLAQKQNRLRSQIEILIVQALALTQKENRPSRICAGKSLEARRTRRLFAHFCR
jgi:hypothetical protein